MTNIHFPVDGLGTQSLKKQNETDKSTFHVDATAPDSKNQNHKKKQSSAKKETANKTIPSETSNSSDSNNENSLSLNKRQDNRRQKNEPILLDTRSQQDRRKTSEQNNDSPQDSHQYGIDTKA